MNIDGIRNAADEKGTCILDVAMCGELADKIDELTAAVEMATRTLELLRESSGNPGQLSDRVTESHDVDWGACPKCGCCTELAFRGLPHGSLQDVVCGKCGWSGALAKL